MIEIEILTKKKSLIENLKNWRKKYSDEFELDKISFESYEKYVDKPSDYPSIYYVTFNKKVRDKQYKDCIAQAISDILKFETKENQVKLFGKKAYNFSKFYFWDLEKENVKDYVEEAKYVLEDWLIDSEDVEKDIAKILKQEGEIPIRLIVANKIQEEFFSDDSKLKKIILDSGLEGHYEN